jgi:hypothetical protein
MYRLFKRSRRFFTDPEILATIRESRHREQRIIAKCRLCLMPITSHESYLADGIGHAHLRCLKR